VVGMEKVMDIKKMVDIPNVMVTQKQNVTNYFGQSDCRSWPIGRPISYQTLPETLPIFHWSDK